MPRYYFNIRDHNRLIKDYEGTELASAKLALNEAISAAREILAEKIERGELVDEEFEIVDALGTMLFTVPFRSAMKLK